MMRKLTAPIKYFGGKGNMYNEIIKYFPDKDDFNTYIEPFGGSYSIGLKLENLPQIEVYNDLERNVYCLYFTLSDKFLFDQFKDKCDLTLYSEDIRLKYLELLKSEDISIVERAFYFFYVNRTSFNGTGGFSMNTHVRRGMSKSISDYLSTIDRLPELHNRLSRVIVSNTDGVELIRRYNDPKILIYCDPPYEQSKRTGARYDVDMNRAKQIEFLDAVIESKSKILISGYTCELYQRLVENGFEQIEFDVKTITRHMIPKTKIETLWKNY